MGAYGNGDELSGCKKSGKCLYLSDCRLLGRTCLHLQPGTNPGLRGRSWRYMLQPASDTCWEVEQITKSNRECLPMSI